MSDALTRDESAASREIEELIAEYQKTRGPQPNISFVAFTATPRNVTLERFGLKGPDGLPHPFHLYSMRQAIEEGFILDVLQNYMTYKPIISSKGHRGRSGIARKTRPTPRCAVCFATSYGHRAKSRSNR